MLSRLNIEKNGDAGDLYPYNSDRIDRLIKYNEKLEGRMDIIRFNENVIESDIEELESILSVSDRLEQYTLCRLTEMTLFCVGNYANNNCITEVGDFMINPRLILVHIKGESKPVIKERYTPLSVQFKDRETENCSVAEWLSRNTIIETVKKPILPYLLELLEKNACSRKYMESVKEQMNLIVDLLGHLSMVFPVGEINGGDWKSLLEKDDRLMIERLLYEFNPAVFNGLGEKINSMCRMHTSFTG